MTLGRPTDFSAREARDGPSVFVSGSMSFGAALLLGALVGALSAIPGAFRAAATGAPGFHAWLALAGVVAIPAGLAIAALHALRPLPEGLRNVGWAVALAFGPIVFFARTLWAGTHHRPLGAVTFSIAVVLLLLAVLTGVTRFRQLTNSGGRGIARALLSCGVAASVGLGLLGAAGVVTDAAARARCVDAGIVFVLVALAGNVRIPSSAGRLLRLAGPVSYIGLGVAAASVLRSPELEAALRAAAPVLLSPWIWVFSG